MADSPSKWDGYREIRKGGKGGIKSQSIDDFQGSEMILYDVTMVYVTSYICPNAQNIQHQK